MNPCPPRLRRRLGHGGLSLLVLAGSSTLLWSAVTGTASAAPRDPVAPAPVCASGTCTVTYTATGAAETFKVPAGVDSLTVRVDGASGGSALLGQQVLQAGGAGGRATGVVPVTPGENLTVVVGGKGQSRDLDASVADPAAGGYGGGGSGGESTSPFSSGGSGGGGGSFVCDGDDALLLAAGGGGAPAATHLGGAGGGGGQPGTNGADGDLGSGGGSGANLATNGTGGAAGAAELGRAFPGADGTGPTNSPSDLAIGGEGGAADSNGDLTHNQVGGGGGGFRAGGGGGSTSDDVPDPNDPGAAGGAGGGGGAGFFASSVTTPVGITGVQAGDGTVVLSYADAPQVSFTSTAPTAVVGGATYTVTASGTGTGAITYSVDEATTNGACTVTGDVVSFVHAGTCAIAADQAADGTSPAAHAVQTFTVAKATQTLTVGLLDTTGHVGDTVDVVATGGGSGLPVVLTVGSGSTTGACTIDGTKLTLTGAGTCRVTASQDGDDDFAAAAPVSRDITVDRVATTVALTFDHVAPVYGQPVTATATVSGASAGAVQFAADGTPLGDPVTIDGDKKASIDLPTTLGADGHRITGTFVPTDAVTYAGSVGELTLPVAKARTTTVLTVRTTDATAVVAAVAPGAGTPEGSVRFSIDGVDAGTVTLDHGKASLGQPVPAGGDVSAVYDGDTDFAGSSDSTSRKDPVITAEVTGTHDGPQASWYSGPVTITFTCTEGSAPLSGDGCPTPVTLSTEGASQNVTGTVTAQDGGIATATVTGINIDLTKPRVSAFFAQDGDRYFVGSVPPAGCSATDDLSGVYGCLGAVETKGKELTYHALAIDQAGNQAEATAHVTTYNRGILDAPYADGAYTVRVGQAYTLVAKSTKRPQLLKPVAENKKPSSTGAKFTSTGDDTWSLGYTIPTSLKPGTTYDLGIKTTEKYSIKIHVVA